ncbi:hypothetical protein ACFL1D_00050 [Candidatus Omnitrophota bacterium]
MFNRKGQSTLEYALIIAVVVAGLLLMQHYVRRGFAGRLKSASDDMGDQYDPTVYTGNFSITQSSEVEQSVHDRVGRTEHTAAQVSSRTGSESVEAWAEDEDLYSK